MSSSSSSSFFRRQEQPQQQQLRWKSGSGGGQKKKSSSFRPRSRPKTGYYARLDRHRSELGALARNRNANKRAPGDPRDAKTPVPRIDRSQIRVRDALDADEEDDLTGLGTLVGGALRSLRAEAVSRPDRGGTDALESDLRTMDFFTSAEGSTEDRVGARRAVAAETYGGGGAREMLRRIDELVERERFEYMDLPRTNERPGASPGDAGDDDGTTNQIPRNQLAHGEWGEMLIRTDRVSKMWRGGRVVSFRALVIGGNLRGCGGFGLGKAFEPEDAVEIACRMAKRNVFFVDRFRGRSLARDLVGRQNSCKVVLRATTNGLRGNPLCCEILKLMGITNVVAKAHGSRNHYNVVRATYKALLTHESLDETAMKRGLRLVNLERAKRLGI